MKSAPLNFDEKQIIRALRSYGILRAAFFGSYARGEATPQSDLDLLVTYPPGTTLFDVMSLQDEIERISGRKVDLVSQKYLSPRLERRIKSDLKPLVLAQ
jgi:predicted nucleotidyltransferase